MPFGLINAPALFQEIMDMIFADLAELGVVWYIDDILIYGGKTEAEHQKIIEKVLAKCVEHGLAVNLSKSCFHQDEVTFLSHVINGHEICMEPDKVETIRKWPIPPCKREVQSFLGFANYYRNFIAGYSQKTKPLTKLTGDVPFVWENEQNQAFNELIQSFINEPVLQQFDRSLPTIMETDASNQAITGILSQFHVKNGVQILHPVEYHSKTLSTSQRNWPIHDKELFAIVDCFKKWRNWLIGIPVDVYTDHQGLKYFNTK